LPINFDPSFWEQTWTYKKGIQNELKAAILAAGLGRRMDPLTAAHLPKPLFPLGGKVPMVEVWVRRFVESGITDISMNLCVLSETIKRHFKDGAKFAADITYVDEETPSGTLGGVCKQALGVEAKRLPSEHDQITTAPFRGSTIIAPSGDIVTNFGAGLLEEMYEIHKKVGAALTMVLVPVPWERRKDFGTVVLAKVDERQGIVSKSGRIKEFVEKDPDSPSNLNNASIYMIEMELLEYLDDLRTEANLDVPHPFYDFGKHVFPALLGRLPGVSIKKDFPLWGIQYDGSWFDVGQKRDYLKVNEYLLDGKLEITLPYERLPWGYLGTNVNLNFSKVNIIPPVIIGNNCIVEPGATLGPYAVIGDDWRIQKRVNLHHSVLWGRYSYFDDQGYEIAAEARKQVDRHEIRSGVTVEHSIIAGGDIQSDIREQTVDVDNDGELRILSIDYVPGGPRA
jgi:mannose-1-phosphate guanylyltransferase/phosphomannomutase